MKKFLLCLTGALSMSVSFAQKALDDGKTVVIQCTEFHVTRPLSELAKEHPIDDNFVREEEESEDREHREPQKFKYSEKDGSQYGNDPSSIQREMGSIPGKAPIQNWAGQTATSFRPFDPSGAAGPNHYVQMINSTTMRVYNKSTGGILLTTTLGNLWSPATANDGDPIVMYDKAADRWFLAQFGQSGNNMYIAVSQTNNPTGAYYTYTFSSPDFPDYLKFSVWADGYYMTGNYAQKVFAFERTAMLAGTPTARSIYKTFSPPNGGGFFVPLPGDASDGALPAVGTPCPIFSYSDNNWGAGFTDAINIYKMAVTWGTTPAATITSAGSVPTAAFDATYDAGWNDVSQPGTAQKLDGIGGVLMYRAQFKVWSGYNTVCLTWAVKISATQRSLKWCELRQNQSTGAWSMYQEGIYTPDTDTRWLGSIAMDNNGAIGLAYLKANSTSTYPGLFYTGRRSCDPLGTLPITETVAQAGTGSQTGMNRDGDYAQMSLDPDGVTFWYTGEYMGGSTGGSAAKTRIFSFQIPTCGPAAPVADFSADNLTPCIGAIVNFTDLSTNTPTSWAWSFSPTTVTYVGGTSSTSQNPKVTFNAAGAYTVTLVATNASGNNTKTKTAYINPMSSGTLPLVENFEGTTFPPTGWTVVNADAPSVAWGTAGAKGFERRAAAGNTGSTLGSAGIECYNYNTDTTQVDELISKPVSLVGATSPKMTFKRAYKYYGTPYFDQLRVFISTDCGATYGSAVYYKKGIQLASNGSLTTSFTPSVAADWDIDTVDLTSYIGQNIIVKFQVASKYGNNVYLDDVNINSTAAAVASVSIAETTGTNPTCAGSSVTFTATPTNGGSAPTYQWQVNGVNAGIGATFTTSTLTNGQIVTCIMTSNLAGVTGSPATSNAITMSVTTPPIATFSYTGTPYCQSATNPSPTFSGGGTAGTFTSTAGLVFVSATTGVVNLAASTPGTYTVTNTKPAAGGCPAVTATSTITITAPSVATFSYTGTPYCQSATNPSPTFSGGGSAGTFTSTTGLVFVSATTGVVNLAASTPGIYTVTNTKPASGGCPSVTATSTITIAAPSVATFSYTGTPYCQSATNPSPTFSGGGTAGTFSSTAGLVFVSATTGVVNLAASTPGTYTVTNTKPASGGCPSVTATSTITIAAPSVATFSYTGTPYCQSATNPSPTFSGGGSAGTFTSTTGLVFVSATTGVVNLAASTPGTYTVTNTKPASGGCPSVTATSTITITAPSVATFSYTGTPYCQSATNPSPTFSGGGTAGTFSSTAGLVFVSATTGVVNLTASTPGTYTVTNTKPAAGGCPAVTATSTITITAPAVATFSYTGTPYCKNGTNPSPTFSGGGSAGTFTSTAGLIINTSTGVVNLAASTAGTYTVTNTKPAAGGCPSVTATSTITITAPAVATFSYTGTPYCQSAANPSPTFSGGGSAGTFTSTAGLVFVSATTGVVNLAASTPGTYTVTNTKPAAGGCPVVTATSTITITAPAVATFSYTGTPYCQSATNPSPTFSGGGTAGTFSSTTGLVFVSTTTGVVNLAASTPGTYTVTNTKPAAGGCPVITATSSITILSGPTAQAVNTTSTGCGASTGTITLGATTGGTGPYTYSVNGSGFTTTTSYTGFAAGSYPVIVKDANGCQFSTSAIVTNSSGPTSQLVTPVNSTCGNANGTITLGATTGGTGPYTYSVNGSAFTSTTSYTGLIAGTYSIIVKDAGGCQFTTSATITDIAGPSSTASGTDASCGNANGSASVNVTGGTPSYAYLWSPVGGTAATITNAAAGTYTVTVTDNNGCISTAVAVISNIPGPSAQNATSTNSNCGGSDGTITVGSTTGGTAPYMYSVNGSAASTNTTYTGFSAGTYPVIVTDANGCSFNTTVTVGNTGTTPATPTVTQTGSTLTSSSATGNQWYNNGIAIPGETGQTFTFTANGNYSVVVTNGGCSSAASSVMSITNVGIGENSGDPYSLLIYPNPSTGQFTISFNASDRSTYRVEIVNALGQLIFRDDLKDFSGSYKKEMSVVEYGQGIYTISLTNSKNETVKKIVVY